MTCRIIATIMGLFFGGPIGAIIGFFIGSFLDQSVNKNSASNNSSGFNWQWRQMFSQSFVRGVFILMGYLAKADGQITSNEIKIASQMMTQLRLSDEQRHQAMRWFYDGKNQQFDIEEVLQKLRLYRQPTFMRILLSCLMNIACANGTPSPAQQKILHEICNKLGIPTPETQQQYSYSHYSHQGQQHYSQPKNTLADDYRLMGLTSDADVAMIKKTYRRLMNKFHPDKLASKNASEKEIKAANEKIYEIRSAYESIMQSKGVTV